MSTIITTQSSRLPASLWTAWTTALLASAASVWFIEILHKPAATFCWVERMLIFGIWLVLTVAILTRDLRVWRYAVPFLVIGTPAALFQQLVHWGVIQLPPQPCSTGVVCTTKYFELFGFVTQATLCLTAFLVVAACMRRLRRIDRT